MNDSGRPAGATAASATVLTGLLGGLYYSYAVSVMPGLAKLDDRAFALAMNHINVAIVNPVFMLSFLGAPAVTVVAAIVELRRGTRASAGWVGGAAVLNLIGLGITAALNIPLNDQLAADSNRAAFESSWVIWNDVRTVVTAGALVALTAGLVARHGTRKNPIPQPPTPARGY